MINTDFLQKIKLHTISALVSDENLMGVLVLKGGNAINLAYDITNRGSMDIDFSMEKDFSDIDRRKISYLMKQLLNNEFAKIDLVAIDINFTDRPKKIHDEVKSFWGGYLLEFKLIDKDSADNNKNNIDALRRHAIPLHEDSSPKFTVDFSKYEYVAKKKKIEFEGAVLYVYSPEMLAIEKIRALCQQVPDYKKIVLSMTSKSRARDFYDIYNITEAFSIDYKLQENIELCKHIFEAKQVPLSFLKKLNEQRNFHRESWESVLNTINQKENLKNFDFYFDYVMDKIDNLL